MNDTDGQADVQIDRGTQVADGPTDNRDIVMHRQTDPFVLSALGSSCNAK